MENIITNCLFVLIFVAFPLYIGIDSIRSHRKIQPVPAVYKGSNNLTVHNMPVYQPEFMYLRGSTQYVCKSKSYTATPDVFREGDVYTVYVSKDDPCVCVLQKRIPFDAYFDIILSAVFFVIGMIFIF